VGANPGVSPQIQALRLLLSQPIAPRVRVPAITDENAIFVGIQDVADALRRRAIFRQRQALGNQFLDRIQAAQDQQRERQLNSVAAGLSTALGIDFEAGKLLAGLPTNTLTATVKELFAKAKNVQKQKDDIASGEIAQSNLENLGVPKPVAKLAGDLIGTGKQLPFGSAGVGDVLGASVKAQVIEGVLKTPKLFNQLNTGVLRPGQRQFLNLLGIEKPQDLMSFQNLTSNQIIKRVKAQTAQPLAQAKLDNLTAKTQGQNIRNQLDQIDLDILQEIRTLQNPTFDTKERLQGLVRLSKNPGALMTAIRKDPVLSKNFKQIEDFDLPKEQPAAATPTAQPVELPTLDFGQAGQRVGNFLSLTPDQQIQQRGTLLSGLGNDVQQGFSTFGTNLTNSIGPSLQNAFNTSRGLANILGTPGADTSALPTTTLFDPEFLFKPLRF